MKKNEDDNIQTGTSEFTTVKAGCGIRFDPETLSQEAGFDFSQAENFIDENDQEKSIVKPKKEKDHKKIPYE